MTWESHQSSASICMHETSRYGLTDICMRWLGRGLTLIYISRSLVSLVSTSFASAAWLLSALALKLASRAASSA